jgi:hypothetical protein
MSPVAERALDFLLGNSVAAQMLPELRGMIRCLDHRLFHFGGEGFAFLITSDF